jgi:hypothetical protein
VKRRPRNARSERAKYGRDSHDSQADVWRMLRASGVTAKSAHDTVELRRGRPAFVRDPRIGRLADC